MNHGEQWSVPLNHLVVVAFIAIWAVTFPFWITMVIALPIALVLGYVGIDKYGGMQIVMLIGLACLVATLAMANCYRDSLVAQSEFTIAPMVLQFIAIMAGVTVLLFAVPVAFVGIVFGRHWAIIRFGVRRDPIADEQSGVPEPPDLRDTKS